MKFVAQLFENDCGIACLKMMLIEVNKDKNYRYLPFKEKKGNYSFQEIRNLAHEHGLNLVGFQVRDKEEIFHNDTFPIMVSLELMEGNKHAVIIEKIKKKRLLILDPASGKRWMKKKEFLSLFDGNGMLIEKSSYTKCPYSFPYTNPYKVIIPSLLQMISACSLILGIRYIEQDALVILPIIFFSLAAIGEIITKSILFSQMKRLDTLILQKTYVDKTQRLDFLKRYEGFKQSEVVHPVKFFTSFIIAFVFCFVLLLNGVNNIFLILLTLLIVLIDAFLISPLLDKNKSKLELIQRRALLESNNQRFIHQSFNLVKKTYSYGKLLLLRKYAYMLIILFSIILMMINSHIVSVPYVVCYFAMTYALLENLIPIFSYSQINYHHEINKCKFFNIIHQNDEIRK